MTSGKVVSLALLVAWLAAPAAALAGDASDAAGAAAARIPAEAIALPARSPFAPLAFLLGRWTGEGTGQPGESAGGFSFLPDLDGKALIRRSHSDYPAAGDRPAFSHEDFMVVYPNAAGLEALYLDNEGHVIRYTVRTQPDSAGAVFETAPDAAPRFRLTYAKLSGDQVSIAFDMAAAGGEWKQYLNGRAKRVAGAAE